MRAFVIIQLDANATGQSPAGNVHLVDNGHWFGQGSWRQLVIGQVDPVSALTAADATRVLMPSLPRKAPSRENRNLLWSTQLWSLLLLYYLKISLIEVALSHCCYRTTLQCYRVVHVTQQKMIVKTGKFLVPAGTRRSTKQPGLAAAGSSKPEQQPSEKRDRRSLCDMSMEQAEQMCR